MTDLRQSLRALTPEQKLRLQQNLPSRAKTAASASRQRLDRTPDRLFALTPAQKRLWFLDALEGPSDQYGLTLACRASGAFEFARFERAIAALEMRHEAFRTVFVETEDGPRQTIASTSRVKVEFEDLSSLPAPKAEAEALDRLRRLAATPFDLANGPLLRAGAYRISATEHLLLIATHHIVADGWSLELVKRELGRFYQDTPSSKDDLGGLGFQLADHAEAVARSGGASPDKLSVWAQTLRGSLGSGGLPADHARTQRPIAGHILQDLSATDWSSVQAFSRRCGVTPFVTLLAAFKLLLSRYAMQRDITVGTSLANRGRSDLAEVVGLFAETVALRTRLPRDGAVGAFLRQVQSCVLSAQENSDVPFEAIVEACRVPRAPGRHPFFDIMFEFETGRAGDMVLGDLRLSPFPLAATTPKFDMSLELRELPEGLRIELEYRADLFEEESVARFLTNYRRLLARVIEDPDRDIATLEFLSEEETALLETWARGPRVHEPVATAHQLFEAQADRTPARTAISCGSDHLTYEAVEQKANRLARVLTAHGLGQGHFVGLLLGRDEYHLIGMLGVLKAGAAFIPLSADWPVERRLNALRDSGVAAVVSAESADSALGPPGEIVSIPWSVVEDHTLCATRLDLSVSPADAAYALYTSGSTGEPKAAIVEHAGMVNHLRGKIDALDIDQNTVLAQMAITTFDVSIWQYLAALVVGGRTVVLPGDMAWDPPQLLAAVPRLGLTLIESVPSHTRILLDELAASPGRYDLSSLKLYVSNGEALTATQCRRWLDLVPHVPIINTYGITETSDDVSHHRQSALPETCADFIPIGPPMRNVILRLLDENLRLAPIGALGELCISGVAVGRGYLNAPDKTAERFVPDPFSARPNARLYRSGDLARQHANGAVQFIGRRDFQIKIRGQRIEIGEVEAHLARHPAVAACAVQAFMDDGSEPELVAYVIVRSGHSVDQATLTAFCEANLSPAMRPVAHVLLDALPLTPSGKVDRARLARPPRLDQDEAREFAPPRTEEERLACEIWAETLDRPAIGIDEDFFDLGGHSLLAAEVVLRMRRALGRDIPLRALFAAPSIRKLLEVLPAKGTLLDQSGLAAPAVGARPAAFGLAPCQIPEWFAYRMAPESPVYNISFTELFMRGLDVDAFIAAWRCVIERHDIFRLRIGYVDGRPSQSLTSPLLLERHQVVLDRRDVAGDAVLPEAARLSQVCSATQFDFENGPLFRFNIVEYGDGRHQLLFVVHHVIWDETSSMNLMRELSECYNAILSERAPRLPDLPLAYSDYVEWINAGIEQGLLNADRDYWHALLASPPPPLALPTDFPRPNLQDFSGASLSRWLSATEAQRIRQFCKQHDLTLFMFFLALIQLYLARLTGASDFIIGCPIAGRDHPELKPMLGLFATPMPIRWRQRDQRSFLDMAIEAREASIEAYEHYRYPATAVIDDLEGARDLSKSRLFSVMYGLQNNKTQLLHDVRLDGVATETLALYSAEANAARFDLTFAVEEKGPDIQINCTYATKLFREETVGNWLSGMVGLLGRVLTDPTKIVETYSICSELDDKPGFSMGERLDVAADLTLHGLFARQAHQAPSRSCLRRETSTFTYGEVDQRSNRLACLMRTRGIGPGSRVGLQLGLGVDLVIAELATLKVGACFVPLGLDLPEARLRAIHEVVQLDGLISAGAPLLGDVAINIDLALEDLAQHSPEEQRLAVTGSDLAYILHTSGSTGIPKAIPVTHANVVSILAATDHRHNLDPGDVVGMFTSPLFDPSILDIFWPLSVGATIAIPQTSMPITPEIFWATTLAEGVTVAQCVPAMLERLVDLGARSDGPAAPNLRLMIVGGAILTRSLRDRFIHSFSAKLMNHYGPTETTIDAAVFDCSNGFDGDVAPIGRALANVDLRVLDARGQSLPIGAEGELYIASPGLSLGYLDRPELNQNAFPWVTMADGASQRMFRTGDVAKRMADGNIVVLGRRDRQVKLGGARVELGEIDLVASTHRAVGLSYTKIVPTGADQPPLLATFIEPASDAVRFVTDQGVYEVYTREQRPDLIKAFTTLHLEAWPAFFEGDVVVRDLWATLGETYADHQICLTDQNGHVAAIAHAAPYSWDGHTASLPPGWSAAVAETLAGADRMEAPNTLVAFVAVVAESFKGRGLSLDLLHALRRFARGKGYDAVLIPVRPTEKADHPLMDFAEYCAWRRPDGHLVDPWLRTHERAGGTLLQVAPCSQEVRGSFDDWRRWSDLDLDQAPDVAPKGGFNPLVVDAGARVATYREPCIWVRHNVDSDVPELLDWSLANLRRDLASQLPSYMTPQHIQVQQRLPLNTSGKIDGERLEVFAAAEPTARVAPVTALQKTLQTLWAEMLAGASPGVTCDFFMLGGRSLDVIRMLTAVEDRLGACVSVRDFYADTTIRGLERCLLMARV